MNHVVLLGDSIFDNERYVSGGPAVIEQVRQSLPKGWRATLLARDGAVTPEVEKQLVRLPDDATHLIVSTGGNDALEQSVILLQESADSLVDALLQMTVIKSQFQQDYRNMLDQVLALGKPTAICTIYDSIPEIELAENAGLSFFNDVITREAFRAMTPLIDLRLVCNEASDYSKSSPIEPSASGGAKIARAISRVLTMHDFGAHVRMVYV